MIRRPFTAAAVAVLAGLGACGTPEPATRKTAWDLHVAAAESAYADGELDQAARQYRRALVAARAGDRPAEVATAAYNLAACQLARGDDDDVTPLLHEARRGRRRSGGGDHDILLLESRVAQRAGDLPGAAAAARRVLDAGAATAAERGQACLVLGQLAVTREDADEARRLLGNAATLLADDDDPTLDGARRELAGRIAMLDGDHATAAARFDEAVAAFASARRIRRMAGLLARAGAAYRTAGDPARAADRLYRAARSFAAQDAGARARPLAVAAEEAAGLAGDDDLVVVVRALLAELDEGPARGRSRSATVDGGDPP